MVKMNGKGKPMGKGKKPMMEASVAVVKSNPRKSKKY